MLWTRAALTISFLSLIIFLLQIYNVLGGFQGYPLKILGNTEERIIISKPFFLMGMSDDVHVGVWRVRRPNRSRLAR